MTDNTVSHAGRNVQTDLTLLPALLQLTDTRFPTGGYAHSYGFEAAARNEGIHDEEGLTPFLEGRLHSTGWVMTVFAAVACHHFRQWIKAGIDPQKPLPKFIQRLDSELDARTPSHVLRTISRRLGRQMLRAGRAAWPHSVLDAMTSAPGQGWHQPICFAAVAAAVGQAPLLTAIAAAQENIFSPAEASVRLLGLDPFKVNAKVAQLSKEVMDIAQHAITYLATDFADLPSDAGYLLDISAEFHATWEVRLFAS